jgi:hypothetical protein
MKWLASPGGQIFGLVCIAFGSGISSISAFEKLLRGESFAWGYLLVALLMCFGTFTMALTVRKLIP